MNDKELDIAYFLSFCIEQYGRKHRLNGDEVVSLFDRYEVLPYLEDNFEALHTQGHQWLMEEIDERLMPRRSAYESGNHSRKSVSDTARQG